MTKVLPIVALAIVAAGLAACAGSDRSASGPEYVGRFDNDGNRPPMLVNNSNPTSGSQVLIYGDGEH